MALLRDELYEKLSKNLDPVLSSFTDVLESRLAKIVFCNATQVI